MELNNSFNMLPHECCNQANRALTYISVFICSTYSDTLFGEMSALCIDKYGKVQQEFYYKLVPFAFSIQDCSCKYRFFWHICLFTKDFDTKLLLPSTQAGLALVVPAIWPFLQAQRAVCRAMVLRGWLLSLSKVTISHVPAANWPKRHRGSVTNQRDETSVILVPIVWIYPWGLKHKYKSIAIYPVKCYCLIKYDPIMFQYTNSRHTGAGRERMAFLMYILMKFVQIRYKWTRFLAFGSVYIFFL